MADNIEQLIGTFSEDSVVWPELNILGHTYDRSQNPPKHIMGKGFFVVGVALPLETIAELLDEIREHIDKLSKANKRGNGKPSQEA